MSWSKIGLRSKRGTFTIIYSTYVISLCMYVWYIVGLGGSRFCGWIKQGSLVWPFTHIIKGMKQKSSWGSALKIPQYGTGFKSFVYYTELVVFLISSLSASGTTSLFEWKTLRMYTVHQWGAIAIFRFQRYCTSVCILHPIGVQSYILCK